jgi:hypothetical protein
MSVRDPMTAKLLADRMVNSFFDGLSEVERMQIAFGGERASQSTGFSMLAYTLNVYLGELSLPEEQGREFFQEAIRKKMTRLRETLRTEKTAGSDAGKARNDE